MVKALGHTMVKAQGTQWSKHWHIMVKALGHTMVKAQGTQWSKHWAHNG